MLFKRYKGPKLLEGAGDAVTRLEMALKAQFEADPEVFVVAVQLATARI